jgi:hypothetical protein
MADVKASVTLRPENLIRELGWFVRTVQVQYGRLEALLAVRLGASPSDLFQTLVDYFIMDNVPILHLYGQFFPALLCRLHQTVASRTPDSHQFNGGILR